jgi:hypothetical protein
MTGQPLVSQTQWKLNTGELLMSGPRGRLNLAYATHNATLGYMLRGGRMSRVRQSGQKMIEQIKLDQTITAEFVHPGQELNAQVYEHGHWIEAHWRILRDYVVTNDFLVSFNAPAGTDRYQQRYDHVYEKMQDMYTSSLSKIGAAQYAVPNKTLMDSAADPMAADWMSLMAINNEFPLGLIPSQFPGGAWTSFMGIVPPANSRWVPTQVPYGGAGAVGFTVGNTNNIMAAMTKAVLKCQMLKPPIHKEYFHEVEVSGQSDYFMTSDIETVTKIMRLWTESKDVWPNMLDPWQNPKFRGIPLVYETYLDYYAGYRTGASDALQTAWATHGNGTDKTGGRVYGWNPRSTYTVFSQDWFMKQMKGGALRDKKQPDTEQTTYATAGNNWCNDRGANFVLFPEANHSL